MRFGTHIVFLIFVCVCMSESAEIFKQVSQVTAFYLLPCLLLRFLNRELQIDRKTNIKNVLLINETFVQLNARLKLAWE